MFHFGGICVWINDIDVDLEGFQFVYNINYLRISDVADVFFEGCSHHQDMCFLDHFSLCNDFLRGLFTDVEAHGIVHVATGVDHLRVVTQLHGFVYQIIRIHTDAVSSDKSWIEFQEIPFCSSGFEDIKGINAHLVEDDRKLVHQRNVDVALCVLNDFRRFCHFDARRAVHTCCNH